MRLVTASRLKRAAWCALATGLAANAAAYAAAWAACQLGQGAPRARLAHARRPQRTPDQLGLGYERHGFRSTDGLFLEGWLIPRPDSRGVAVLFHGYGADKSQLLREARAFHRHGLSPFLVDFRGSGGSGGRETSIGFHEARDVRAALAYARSLPGRPRTIAYGISMGAASVLKAEADGDLGVDGLVLECPFDRLLTTVNHRFEERNLPAFPMSRLLVFWGGWRQGFDAFAHNPVDYARRGRAPVLLLSGANDTYVTPDESGSIARALGSRGRLVVCPGVRHASCLGGQAPLWHETVGSFLDAVLGPQADPPSASPEGGSVPAGG
jgi:alpha-beta hydrolase superfamily lysophospholipase